MTGGVDEGYGSASSSRIPAERPDEERSLNADVDGLAEKSRASDADDGDDAVPHTRPFRAWGAAHEAESPSLWQRFLGWMRTLFSQRKNDAASLLIPAHDDFNEERADNDLRKVDSPRRDAEPQWDAPVVAESAPSAPPALNETDFAEVWKQRVSPLETIDWKSLEDPPKQPGFFARLFSRKKKEEPIVDDDETFDDVTALHPVHADFAEDAAASAAPAHDDFASEPEATPRPPAIDPKGGFFSGLVKPASRSQLTPEQAGQITAPMEAVKIPAPGDPPALVPPKEPGADMDSTHPFPAFRDARDDFAEDSNDRSKKQREEDAEGEGEKTDEFEAVPPPVEMGSTAETRQVAGFLGRMFGKKDDDRPVSSEMPTMGLADEKMPFVLAKFRGFYNEVIRDKHQKSDVIAGFATAVMGASSASSESDPEFAAQLLSKRLSEMLELQAAESNWTGGDAAKYYPEAQYAMVALADETFATIDWPGRSSWHKYMLEPKMYGTRGADIEFFKRIDKLLKEAPNEKGARDLARLYLMVIASGYRGKFRVPNVRRPLAEYRRRLYEYSHQADPLELYSRDRRIFPQAAAHTLVSRSLGRFTPAQKWIAVALVLAALYIGVSHYMWSTVSADLHDVMSRIQSSISQPAPR